MKIRHHSIFNDLIADNIDWEKLRDNPLENHYYIPSDKNEYISILEEQPPIQNIIFELKQIISENKIHKILSLGCGRAYLEYQLNKKVNVKIDISDQSDSIERIKGFKIFNDSFFLDFSKVFELKNNNYQLVLLSRIDTELTDVELENLFKSLFNSDIKFIYFIPAELITLKTFFVEIKIYLKSLLLNKKRVFCGFARSEKCLIKSWSNFYNYKKDSQNNYFLFNDPIQ